MCQCHRIVIEKYLRVSIFERDKRDIRVQGTEQISECYLLPVASNLLTAAILEKRKQLGRDYCQRSKAEPRNQKKALVTI